MGTGMCSSGCSQIYMHLVRVSIGYKKNKIRGHKVQRNMREVRRVVVVEYNKNILHTPVKLSRCILILHKKLKNEPGT